ncbi:MAG: hypothetical protein AABX89_06810 [Candidatus Thermoplasmatota archaeon]
MTRRPFFRDERGAIQAFEAVLAAILILSALILFSLVQRPATPAASTGLDLQQVAADALAVLGASGSSAVGDAVANALRNNDTPLRTSFDGSLPSTVRWKASLSNGFGSLTLASSDPGVFSTPRSAQGASVYTTIAGWAGPSGPGMTPGSPISFGPTCTGLDAPGAGGTTGPGGTSWFSRLGTVPGPYAIPEGFPFGAWTFTGPPTCTSTFNVVLGATTAATPIYTLDLVVWTLA